MLSLDEAIKMYKKIANTDANCPAYCNISCDKCVQESKQIAEWLEELKDYQDKNKMVVRVDVENMDSIKDKIEELSKYAKSQYNKAIDDFVNKINESNQGHWRPTRYEHGEVVSETMSYDIGTIRLIAEQLKAGVKE